MGRFWSLLENINASEGRLPLIHVTDIFHFRDISSDNKLEPADCDVYQGEKLLYFFYGRPSYRPHARQETVTAKSLLPICLVINRAVANQSKRIMPFDTGAFHHNRVHPPMHRDMELQAFELAVAPDAPMKLIKFILMNSYHCSPN